MTNPAIALRKLASQPTFHAGDVITFTLAVRNTGDVPLTDIVVTDTLVNLTDAPCVDSLEPDEIADCAIEASYTATAADETAGEIVNEAEVSGTPPTGAPVTNSAVAVLTVGPPPAAPGIIMRKIATHDTFVVDDAIEYTFRVGNAGNVPLTDVTIDDPKLGIVNAPCAGVLEVGEAVMCTTTGSYVATQADVDSGTITNTATATLHHHAAQSWPERRTRWLERDRRVGAGIDGGEHERIGWFLQHPAVDGHGHRRAARRVGRATAGGHRDHGFGDGNAERGLHPAPCG